MGYGLSIILIAIGAILNWGFDTTTWDMNGTIIHADNIGVILMIVGAIGLVVSLIWAAMFSRADEPVVHHDTIVDRVPGEEPVRVVRRRKVRKIDRDPNYPTD